ncbi:hypothetical protein D6C95_00192 [Aureobasidium pullulans]|nr:hypothetical protein D6C92_03646 [Aureobasidium pullulans]THZ10933.1 hypothetical protein D6C95_00192 [Aureobasidium pullulans]TIA47757.1 hypothetical protein D6C79_04462 [Aureobasidium pullulans]
MFSPWVLLLLSILAVYVNASPLLEARKNGGANKGGPASAKVTIYSQYTCAAPNTLPPTDGSAGTANNFNIAEAQCTIPNTGLSFGGAITASLTAEPKTGTAGSQETWTDEQLGYVVGHSQQGCGITLSNYIYGWPFAGTAVGNTLGCGNAPSGTSWNAFEIICE